MSYIRLKYPPDKNHECPTPGWWDRLTAGVKEGAIWQCDECHKYWIWKYASTITDGWTSWRLYKGVV